MKESKRQVGGNHYKGMKIQPTEFIALNEIPFIEAMSDADIHLIGMVTESQTLLIEDGYDALIQSNVPDLTKSWKEALDMTGGV